MLRTLLPLSFYDSHRHSAIIASMYSVCMYKNTFSPLNLTVVLGHNIVGLIVPIIQMRIKIK